MDKERTIELANEASIEVLQILHEEEGLDFICGDGRVIDVQRPSS